MSEQSKENFDDTKFRTRQRRAVGIVKVCVSDQIPAQRAAGRDLAFDDVHAEHPVASREIVVFSERVARTAVVTIDERQRCGLISHGAVHKKTGA
jgi:hypothetical protein